MLTIISSLFIVAGLSDNGKLLGSDAQSSALVSQWTDFADSEVLVKAGELLNTTTGTTPYTKPHEQKAWDALTRSFKYLESYLKKQTFLVGHRLTLADLALASVLQFVFRKVAGPEFRDQYPNTVRYYETVINQPTIQDIYSKGGELATANAKFTPPPKEAKAKAAPAAAAAAPTAAAPKKADKKKKADDEEEEEEKPADPPAKHPLASLPPSPFILDEAKRNYSNWETPDFLKWFYEHFDKAGYSIWRFDFKYNQVR